LKILKNIIYRGESLQAGGLFSCHHRRRERGLLKRELKRWLPLLIAHEQPEKIIVFGSYGTDQVGEWSDLDIVIVKET
jgi:hypothetical protein